MAPCIWQHCIQCASAVTATVPNSQALRQMDRVQKIDHRTNPKSTQFGSKIDPKSIQNRSPNDLPDIHIYWCAKHCPEESIIQLEQSQLGGLEGSSSELSHVVSSAYSHVSCFEEFGCLWMFICCPWRSNVLVMVLLWLYIYRSIA